MAELVHRRTEEMLSELEQLQRVNLFTAKEIKAIIKKRTNYEYKLVRRTKDKDDFISYIHYEINLLDLIHKRRLREQYFFKKDEIEYAIVSRIHRLFKQMTFRWTYDLKLWMDHASFCIKWGKKIQLSKLCTKFLQIHGNKPKMWILAAKWEVECGGSMEKGRSLFMKAVKLHPQDKSIWLEFFRAELLFADKLRKRLKLLAASDIDIDDLDNSESRLMNGDAARIVYNNAIVAIPDDVPFHTKFLDIVVLFLETSTFSADVINEIEDRLWRDYKTHPVARSSLARLHLHRCYGGLSYKSLNIDLQQQECDTKCWKAFDDALNDVDTNEMWGEYVDCVITLSQESEGSRNSLFQSRLDHAVNIIFKAHRNDKLNDDQYMQIAKFLLKHGLIGLTNEILHDRCQSRCRTRLLLKQIEVSLLLAVDDDAVNCDVGVLFEKCASRMSDSTLDEQSLFWEMWMQFAIIQSDEKLAESIIAKHSVGSNSQCGGSLVDLYLRWVAAKRGVEAAFQRFEEIYVHQIPSLKRCKSFLNLVQSSSETIAIRRCFEIILRQYGSNDPNIWLEYIKYFQKCGNSAQIGSVYWRAKKTLQPELVEQFITGYAMLDFNRSLTE